MAKSSRPTLAHRLQFALFLVVEWLVSTLSWRATWNLGRAIGRLFCRIDARHRRVVRENLRASDLGLDEAGVQAMSMAAFEHFGGLLFTTLRIMKITPEELRRITRIEGQEHLETAFREGKGVVGLTAHIGNWELLALAVALGGWKLAAIGRELDNPLLEASLVGENALVWGAPQRLNVGDSSEIDLSGSPQPMSQNSDGTMISFRCSET